MAIGDWMTEPIGCSLAKANARRNATSVSLPEVIGWRSLIFLTSTGDLYAANSNSSFDLPALCQAGPTAVRSGGTCPVNICYATQMMRYNMLQCAFCQVLMPETHISMTKFEGLEVAV